MHPTKRHLLDTALAMLETRSPESITTEEVLTTSGISKGSLYHHFEDFHHLIETALVARFAAFVDAYIAIFTRLLSDTPDKQALMDAVRETVRASVAPGGAEARFERAALLGAAARNPRLRAALGAEQQRLTDASEQLVRDAMDRGLLKKSADPRALAVFFQAYTLGKLVDEVTPQSLDPESWVELITTVIAGAFVPDAPSA